MLFSELKTWPLCGDDKINDYININNDDTTTTNIIITIMIMIILMIIIVQFVENKSENKAPDGVSEGK